LGQLGFVALDHPASVPKSAGNKGIPLPEILKFKKPFQEWGEKFFFTIYTAER